MKRKLQKKINMKRIIGVEPEFGFGEHSTAHNWMVLYENEGKNFVAEISLMFDQDGSNDVWFLDCIYDEKMEIKYCEYGIGTEEFFENPNEALEQFKAFIIYMCGGIAQRVSKNSRLLGVPIYIVSLLKHVMDTPYSEVEYWDSEQIKFSSLGEQYKILMWKNEDESITWTLLKHFGANEGYKKIKDGNY
jgi:hypothetical protein